MGKVTPKTAPPARPARAPLPARAKLPPIPSGRKNTVAAPPATAERKTTRRKQTTATNDALVET